MGRILWAVACWPLAAMAADPAHDPALDEITRCMRANVPQTVRIQQIEVTSWDRVGGERRLKGKLYGTREKERVRVMMRIEAPSDLAGASFLVREGETSDETYLYLPAVQRVRRITGGQLDGQLWGTDLSYNDLKQLQNAFSGAEVRLEPATEPLDGREVRALTMTPRAEDGSRYKSIRTLVDRQTCMALKVEFAEPAGLRKVLTVAHKDLKQSSGHWYAAQAEVRDLKNGTRTRVTVTGVSSGDKLAGRYFSPQSFYLGN
jgi:Outer membrane lipoprotein-sorting protein